MTKAESRKWTIGEELSENAVRRRTANLVSGNGVRLRSKWHEGMSMPALISIRDELDGMLQRIRTGRNIQTPIITCRRCGTTGRAAEPHVSVRALILALGRFEIASTHQTRALEKAWAEYRKQHRLDIEGKVPSRVPGTCPH